MKLKGSYLVEAAFAVPFVTILILIVVYTGFLYYDRSVIDAGAAEIAWRIAAEEKQGEGSHKEMLENWKEKLENRLLLCESIDITFDVDKGVLSYNTGVRTEISLELKKTVPFADRFVGNTIKVSSYAAAADADKWMLIRDAATGD